MLTIKDQQRDVRKGLAAAVDDYISNPFDTEELRARPVSTIMLDVLKLTDNVYT